MTLPDQITLRFKKHRKTRKISLQPVILPGSEEDPVTSFQASDFFGSVLIRIISLEKYHIWESHYQVREATTLSVSAGIPFLGLVYTLKNDLQYTAQGFPDGQFLKDHYNMAYSPAGQIEYTISEPGNYYTFAIQFDPPSLQEWLQAFPQLEHFLDKVRHHIPTMISPEHRPVPGEIKEIIDSMRRHATGEPHHKPYLEIRTKDLLLHSLEDIFLGKPPSQVTLHSSDIKNIREVWDYQIEHLDDPYSLKKLASLAGMSSTKFKTGFKQLYSKPPFHALQEERLQKARKLLANPDLSIMEISVMTGFKNISNFTQAFTKRFGRPPSDFRH